MNVELVDTLGEFLISCCQSPQDIHQRSVSNEVDEQTHTFVQSTSASLILEDRLRVGQPEPAFY